MWVPCRQGPRSQLAAALSDCFWMDLAAQRSVLNLVLEAYGPCGKEKWFKLFCLGPQTKALFPPGLKMHDWRIFVSRCQKYLEYLWFKYWSYKGRDCDRGHGVAVHEAHRFRWGLRAPQAAHAGGVRLVQVSARPPRRPAAVKGDTTAREIVRGQVGPRGHGLMCSPQFMLVRKAEVSPSSGHALKLKLHNISSAPLAPGMVITILLTVFPVL